MNTKKIALVTGASSDIGEAIAQRLYAAGYNVYGTSRRGGVSVQCAFAPASAVDAGIRKNLRLHLLPTE